MNEATKTSFSPDYPSCSIQDLLKLSLKKSIDILREYEEKTWSELVADDLQKKAFQKGVSFSFSSEKNMDIFTFGNEQSILTKKLVCGSTGADDGVIRVFIKRDDFSKYSWLREVISAHPINYVLE